LKEPGATFVPVILTTCDAVSFQPGYISQTGYISAANKQIFTDTDFKLSRLNRTLKMPTYSFFDQVFC